MQLYDPHGIFVLHSRIRVRFVFYSTKCIKQKQIHVSKKALRTYADIVAPDEPTHPSTETGIKCVYILNNRDISNQLVYYHTYSQHTHLTVSDIVD